MILSLIASVTLISSTVPPQQTIYVPTPAPAPQQQQALEQEICHGKWKGDQCLPLRGHTVVADNDGNPDMSGSKPHPDSTVGSGTRNGLVADEPDMPPMPIYTGDRQQQC